MTLVFDIIIVLIFGGLMAATWDAGAEPVVAIVLLTAICTYALFTFGIETSNTILVNEVKENLELFVVGTTLGVIVAELKR